MTQDYYIEGDGFRGRVRYNVSESGEKLEFIIPFGDTPDVTVDTIMAIRKALQRTPFVPMTEYEKFLKEKDR